MRGTTGSGARQCSIAGVRRRGEAVAIADRRPGTNRGSFRAVGYAPRRGPPRRVGEEKSPMNDPTLNLLALLREQGITFTLESGVLLMHSPHGGWLSAKGIKEM